MKKTYSVAGMSSVGIPCKTLSLGTCLTNAGKVLCLSVSALKIVTLLFGKVTHKIL